MSLPLGTFSSLKVKTTLPALPLPPNALRPPITTPRLLLRAPTPDDLPALHALRAQPEVMVNSPRGVPDANLAETRRVLESSLAPNDETSFNFAICLRESGEFIGLGGCTKLASLFGWPAIGYMIRSEHWGKGLTTEFVAAWLGEWAKLPRAEVELEVDPRSAPDLEGGTVPEQITSFTVADNVASQKVLEKCGFRLFLARGEADLRNPEVEVELRGYTLTVSGELEV